jgi:hypothetical protein
VHFRQTGMQKLIQWEKIIKTDFFSRFRTLHKTREDGWM